MYIPDVSFLPWIIIQCNTKSCILLFLDMSSSDEPPSGLNSCARSRYMANATVTYWTCVIRIGFEIDRLEAQAPHAPWCPRLKSRRSAMSPMSHCARYASMRRWNPWQEVAGSSCPPVAHESPARESPRVLSRPRGRWQLSSGCYVRRV